MHGSCMEFGEKALGYSDINQKRVIEVGSYDVNGSWAARLKGYDPELYIGVDIEDGENVDIVVPVSQLTYMFGENSFDVVISTEMIEHVEDWRSAVDQLKSVCRVGGILCLTSRGIGMVHHGYPDDWWRFQIKDIYRAFMDFDISYLEADKELPGFFFKGVKTDRPKVDLTAINVYSIKDGQFK